MWYLHTMKHYLASIKKEILYNFTNECHLNKFNLKRERKKEGKKEILLFLTTLINLEGIVVREINQTEK